jgi:integrase
MRTLRILWNHARQENPSLPECPVMRLRDRWNPEAPRTRRLTKDQYRTFYNAVAELPNTVHADLIRLILFTGLRQNEAASLRWDSVDFSERVIRLPASAVKGKRDFHLPMSDYVHDLLVARRSVGNAGGFVFPSNSGTAHTRTLQHSFEQLDKICGVRISAHDLRRGYVSACAWTGIDMTTMKRMLNHSLGQDVTTSYMDLTVENLREPVQRVCDVLKQLCGTGYPTRRRSRPKAKSVLS